jgi:F-type H+-transporting ATPase subunit delta
VSARSVARRYAKALAEIGESKDTLLDLQRELDAVDALVKGSPDLERLVSFPLFAPSKRTAAFDAILEKAGVSDILRKFFTVVAQAARLSLLHDIVAAFHDLVDEKMGVMEAQITSAQVLTAPQTSRLTASLASRTGKTIRIRWHQEPSLLGGLKVQLGSTVYDASIQGRLRLLKQQLLSA